MSNPTTGNPTTGNPTTGSGRRAPRIRRSRSGWTWTARLALAVLACTFTGAGQAQPRYDDLGEAVGALTRALVKDGGLPGRKVFVGAGDFFEVDTRFHLRPRLSETLHAGCRTVLTNSGAQVVLVESDAVRVLHGRWRRETHGAQEHLRLTLFIAEPVERGEPVATVSRDALVPIESIHPADLELTLLHWGDSVVRQLERDLPGTRRYRLRMRLDEIQGVAQPGRFGGYLRNRWQRAFTGSERFTLVGDATRSDGQLFGAVSDAGRYVEIDLYIRDNRGHDVAGAYIEPAKAILPPGIFGPDLTAEFAKCAGLVGAERLGAAKECYEGVHADAPEGSQAHEDAHAGLERIADDEAFERAKGAGTVAAYERYLSSCAPLCGHAEEARRLKAAAEEREPGRRFRDCAECPELVVVPSGSYMMGSPSGESGRFDHEGPVHRVRIGQAFAVGVKEVTVGEYGRFVSETGRSMGDSCRTYEGGGWEERSGRSWRNPGFSQTDGHPVVCVNWDDAKAYVGWLSGETGEEYRLLSESEWEYVARGGTGTSRYWGESEVGQCRNANGADREAKRHNSGWTTVECDDGHYRTAPVGSYEENGYGLHDVLGNVWEWVEDCWNGSYAGAPTDGSAWESGECGRRVLRGGSWVNGPGVLRSAFRDWYTTGNRGNDIGFRVARTLMP